MLNLVIGSFVILAAVVQCTDAFILAGEDTPVWTARCLHKICDDRDNLVTFERLEKGAVKRAIDYMNSAKFQKLHTKRDRRSIEDHGDYAEPDINVHLPPRDTETVLESLESNRTRSKRAGAGIFSNGYIQSNLLVVTQYASELKDDASKEKFINEQILYVLAYWRSFNLKVGVNTKFKNWPKVKLHVDLVGIVIALDRGATPYLSSSRYAENLLRQSNTYWNSPQAEFPRKAYHAVATMTDIHPYDEHIGFFEASVPQNEGTIIVWDRMNFKAIRKYTALVAFRQVIGNLIWWARHDPEVPDYMKPGKAVNVLPGQLFTPEEQCLIAGYEHLERLCPEYSEHCEIWCRNSGWLRSCGSIGTAFEGTPCVNGKVGL